MYSEAEKHNLFVNAMLCGEAAHRQYMDPAVFTDFCAEFGYDSYTTMRFYAWCAENYPHDLKWALYSFIGCKRHAEDDVRPVRPCEKVYLDA